MSLVPIFHYELVKIFNLTRENDSFHKPAKNPIKQVTTSKSQELTTNNALKDACKLSAGSRKIKNIDDVLSYFNLEYSYYITWDDVVYLTLYKVTSSKNNTIEEIIFNNNPKDVLKDFYTWCVLNKNLTLKRIKNQCHLKVKSILDFPSLFIV